MSKILEIWGANIDIENSAVKMGLDLISNHPSGTNPTDVLTLNPIQYIEYKELIDTRYQNSRFWMYVTYGPWDISWSPVNPARQDMEISHYLNNLMVADYIFVSTNWQKLVMVSYLGQKGFSIKDLENRIEVAGIPFVSSNLDLKKPLENRKRVFVDQLSMPTDYQKRFGMTENHVMIDFLELHTINERDYNLYGHNYYDSSHGKIDELYAKRLGGIKNFISLTDSGFVGTDYDFFISNEICDTPFYLVEDIYRFRLHPILPAYGPFIEIFKPQQSGNRFLFNPQNGAESIFSCLQENINNKSDPSFYIEQHLDFNYENILRRIKDE